MEKELPQPMTLIQINENKHRVRSKSSRAMNEFKTFDIIFCNYNGTNLTNIETISDNNMSFFINLLCFDDEKDRKLKDNSLDMGIEIHKYSDDYLKRNSIKAIN